MTTSGHSTFAAISRCISQAEDHRQLPVSLREEAYRELWAARRLIEAAQRVVASADWTTDEQTGAQRAPVARYDLVLLEAAVLVASGERATTPDGFPHAGCAIGTSGVCDAGCCPCHDERRPPQPPLLRRAA